MGKEFFYDAFISYSTKDCNFAEKLEKALEKYRPPKSLDNVPNRYLKIFRYEADMRGVDYHKSIRSHLASSKKLIVICSPDARVSRWVNEEIEDFFEMRGIENIVPVIISGLTINEVGDPLHESQAFPPSITRKIKMPLAADYRPKNGLPKKLNSGIYEGEWFKLLANLLDHAREDVEERTHKRQRKRLINIVLTLIVLIIILGSLTFIALYQSNIAKEQTIQADVARIEAEKQRDLAKLSDSLANVERDLADSARIMAEFQRDRARRSDSIARIERDLAIQNAQIAAKNALFLSIDNLIKQENYTKVFRLGQLAHKIAPNDPRTVQYILSSGYEPKYMSLPHESAVHWAEFSSRGDLILTASEDNMARLWDVDGQLKTTFHGHRDDVVIAKFSPSDDYVLTVSNDYSLRLWDLQGSLKATFIGHTQYYFSIKHR